MKKKQTTCQNNRYPFGDPKGIAYIKRLRKKFLKKINRPPKSPPDPKLIRSLRIKKLPCIDIKNSIGEKPAESGGVLIGNPASLIIECFVFDILSPSNRTVYQPNTVFLNSVLKGRSDQFLGIAHSHNRGFKALSQQDMNAAWSNITSPANSHLNAFLMPLIQTIPDTGKFEIIPYIVTCHPDGKGRVIVHQVDLKIIE